MKRFHLFIIVITLASCQNYSDNAKKELTQKLRGNWQTIFKTTNQGKYNHLNFLNDSTVVGNSGSKIDTLYYQAGISSISVLYPDGHTSYFYVTEINEKHLTLREDVSGKFKSETSIHYERSPRGKKNE